MHYKNTYLKQVILRLDYGRIAALSTEQETPFTADLRSHGYPAITSTPTQQLSFMVMPGGVNVGQQGVGWLRTHRTEDGNCAVSLAPEFLAIEYVGAAYQHFEELQGRLGYVFGCFRKYFAAPQFTRIGLRYVNEITLDEGGPLEWDGLINPALVTSVKAGLSDGLRMSRSVHQFIALKDDVSVILNYGINNPDFPNPVARRQFILDLDCYVSGVIESGEVEPRVKEVNALAEQMFEHSIEQDLRDEMGIAK